MALDRLWAAGDWAMYPILLLAIFAAPCVLLCAGLTISPKAARTATVMSTIVAALGLVALLTGALGQLTAMRRAEAAVATVNPLDRPTILAAAREEARVAWYFGLIVGLPTLAIGGGVLGLGLARLSKAAREGAS